MKYLSVCSGIEAATVAWHDMGWNPIGFSEIEKFPSEVLKHHYPLVPNFGDMTKFKEWKINEPIGLLVGGTPCQSFSVAGLRKGLEDPRGNLALTYCGILDHFRPKWCVWENVPGVLSSNKGRDFGAFLGALVELGYGFAYRVLDAQYFGVAQRRRRVFVVGHFGDWKPAAEVLFESESLSRNIKTSKKTREETANCLTTRIRNDYETESFVYENHGTDSRLKEVSISPTITARWGTGGNNVPLVQPISFDLAQITSKQNGTQVEPNLFVSTLAKGSQMYCAYSLQGAGSTSQNANGDGFKEEQSYTLNRTDVHGVAHAFKVQGGCEGGGKGYLGQDEQAFTISTVQDQQIKQGMAVRRLTPIECERLQGFPDNYTNIKENCPDSPRYKALGNSMAVPVMKWIGKKINQYGEI